MSLFPARSALAALLLSALCAPRVLGGEPKAEKTPHDSVKGFTENIYDLEKAGLKDLSVELDTPIFRGSPLFKHIKVMVYYKTPGRHRLDIVGLPEETRDFYLDLLRPITTLTRYLFGLGSILIKVLEDSDIAVEKEGELTRIEASPRTEALAAEFKKIVVWVDETYKPVKVYQESPALGKITVKCTAAVLEGKNLVTGLSVTGVEGIEGEIRMKIQYEKTEKVLLPTTVSMQIAKPGMDPEKPLETQEFHFKAYKINKGVDEAVFEKKEKKDSGY